MLKQLRQIIVQNLWETYRVTCPDMQHIEKAFKKKGIHHHVLDHFAIIDLPGPNTGIPPLSQIFSTIGYCEQGKDYLADKQNDFLWMAESDCMELPLCEVLPQVVVADFRFDEMPLEIRTIIEKYSVQAKPSPIQAIRALSQRIASGDANAMVQCSEMILHYLSGRDWPLPTTKEFYAIQDFNELLAWVLVFGRRPNHFTLSIHLLSDFTSLSDFHHFIEKEACLSLNQENGTIKGGKHVGIAQGSTSGMPQIVKLSDGEIKIPTGFIEFVWRYPNHPTCQNPTLWNEYFTGFIAQHADSVIESLYTQDPSR
ncbi:MAG: DUF1338 domain-containing protein [Gammaproteobacteria bacterium]|nr:DUF1338 domain-containing protein [Gammaproteobacteria bacterium]MCW5583680.1 DUF1338 domain-containing protein [Gammaproteobacteria bacterium]